MAVYRRTYARYSGPLANERWRFTVLPRFMLKTVFASRISAGVMVLAIVPHLIALLLIYLRSHVDSLVALQLSEIARDVQFLQIDGRFFLTLFAVETFIS